MNTPIMLAVMAAFLLAVVIAWGYRDCVARASTRATVQQSANGAISI